MKEELSELVNSKREKTIDAISLLEDSINNLPAFDTSKKYTPKKREPYDALCDRFVRAIEISLKFFRGYELLMFAENSDTVRDLLNRTEKIGLISSTEMWLLMRELRNRIVHDYLPEQLQQIYGLICGNYGKELLKLKAKLKELKMPG